jgi:hypothetical protein
MVPANNAKIERPEMSGFTKVTAVIPRFIMDSCPEIIQRLQKANIVQYMGISNAICEIKDRPLSNIELISFLKWIVLIQKTGLSSQDKTDIFNNLIWINSQNSLNSISSILYFTTSGMVPNHMPIPSSVLPIDISSSFSLTELKDCFWGWRELPISEWCLFVVQHNDFKIPSFVEKFMHVLGRHYRNMSASEKSSLFNILKSEPCIVSTKGMVIPSACYLASFTLFNDLPKVAFEKQLPQAFIVGIGVRETVELQLFFDRFNDLSWDQCQVYLY